MYHLGLALIRTVKKLNVIFVLDSIVDVCRVTVENMFRMFLKFIIGYIQSTTESDMCSFSQHRHVSTASVHLTFYFCCFATFFCIYIYIDCICIF